MIGTRRRAARPAPPAGAGQGRLPYLRSTCDLLWPPPTTVTLGRRPGRTSAAKEPAAGPEPGSTDSEFLLLLGERRPRLVVPAMRRASAAAVRGYCGLGSPAARLGARMLSLALASGIGAAAARGRIQVRTPPGAGTIESHLREALGRDLVLSLYLGPARANRKPIVQILTPQGEVVGFAKIGTGPLTKALVQAERAALTRLGQAEIPDVTVPRVLHYAEWRGMNVLVLSALPVWLRRRPVSAARLAAAMNSVARVDGERGESLGDGTYLRRLTSRLAGADSSADRDALLGALDTLSVRARQTSLTLGSWHGDWTPWNMACTRGGLLVWDWERYTGGVPLGFDALHYRLQAEVVPGRQEPRAAAARCIEQAPAVLAGFGHGASEARITATLYLADLAARYLADRQAQAGARLGAPGTWLIPAVTEHVRGL